jgi:RNA polymerase sigma-70 factor (sigma-E family)
VLLRWARAVAGDPHSAEDLLQDSLVRVLPRWECLRERAAADAYVRRTITRQYVSWQRQPWRRDEVSSDDLPETVADVGPRPPVDPSGRLWDLVVTLPPQQRAAVALRYYEQLSVVETAAVLGCSTGTVKSNTSRGIEALRRLAAHQAPTR